MRACVCVSSDIPVPRYQTRLLPCRPAAEVPRLQSYKHLTPLTLHGMISTKHVILVTEMTSSYHRSDPTQKCLKRLRKLAVVSEESPLHKQTDSLALLPNYSLV